MWKSPKENNNNCILCPENGTKFFDLGNCKENCKKGIFEDDVETILKCKCSIAILDVNIAMKQVKKIINA